MLGQCPHLALRAAASLLHLQAILQWQRAVQRKHACLLPSQLTVEPCLAIICYPIAITATPLLPQIYLRNVNKEVLFRRVVDRKEVRRTKDHVDAQTVGSRCIAAIRHDLTSPCCRPPCCEPLVAGRFVTALNLFTTNTGISLPPRRATARESGAAGTQPACNAGGAAERG